jgi:hypothetical protein
MAQGNKEHRMLFDIRGRRGIVIKIVYVLFALLMVASLFLVTGAVNLNTLFSGNTSGESAASNFQKQAVKIEAKLKKEPESEDLLASLTRTRLNVANSLINEGAYESVSAAEELKQEYALASEAWSNYLAAAKEPSVGLALQVAPALAGLASLSVQLSENATEGQQNMKAAAEAQNLVAEKRPSLNSFSNLAFYQLFAGNFKAAEAAKEETIKLSKRKFQREQFENQYEQEEKSARSFDKQVKLESVSKKTEAAGEGSGGKSALEKPSLGGLGGPSLGE